MPFLLTILPLLQLFCIIHILRNQRPWWWFMVVFFFPPFGAIAYILVEIKPHRHAALKLPVPQIWLIKKAEQQLREYDTWDNKCNLAELYARSGRFDEAIALLKPALETLHRKDPYILYTLAVAYVEHEDYAQATDMLQRIDDSERKELLPQRNLLCARIAHANADATTAEALFKQAQQGFNGEEARCRFALSLLDTGRVDEAQQQFQRIVDNTRKAPAKYRRDESEWIRYAKAQLVNIARGQHNQTTESSIPA